MFLRIKININFRIISFDNMSLLNNTDVSWKEVVV